MLMLRLKCRLDHVVVDGIYATGHGFGQATTGYDSVKLGGDAGFREFAQNHLATEVELVGDLGERCKFLGRVTNGLVKLSLAIFKDGNLGRSGTGIDD